MKKDLFEETKIRMIMKLKKLSHSAAVEEIAARDVRPTAPQVSRQGDSDLLMSAKEFFEEE